MRKHSITCDRCGKEQDMSANAAKDAIPLGWIMLSRHTIVNVGESSYPRVNCELKYFDSAPCAMAYLHQVAALPASTALT